MRTPGVIFKVLFMLGERKGKKGMWASLPQKKSVRQETWTQQSEKLLTQLVCFLTQVLRVTATSLFLNSLTWKWTTLKKLLPSSAPSPQLDAL